MATEGFDKKTIGIWFGHLAQKLRPESKTKQYENKKTTIQMIINPAQNDHNDQYFWANSPDDWYSNHVSCEYDNVLFVYVLLIKLADNSKPEQSTDMLLTEVGFK